MVVSIHTALRECEEKGFYTCECGNAVEADGKCYCGEKNPLSGLV